MKEGTKPELPLPGEEALKIDKQYVILSVEEFKSDVQGFLGWRVVLDGGSDNILAIALWVRDIVGRKSKLGAFIAVLGNDPDTWIGKGIKVINWEERQREIEEVE